MIDSMADEIAAKQRRGWDRIYSAVEQTPKPSRMDVLEKRVAALEKKLARMGRRTNESISDLLR
ncbi:MAG: hypothetical protein LC130_10085 [Bryobacterales bacterium]|nr:hypothetical protein [Bryobacterales bacterium]